VSLLLCAREYCLYLLVNYLFFFAENILRKNGQCGGGYIGRVHEQIDAFIKCQLSNMCGAMEGQN
jgi:hypothetical protein